VSSGSISVLDFRYYRRNPVAVERLGPYFSEEAFIAHLARVEAALAKVLCDRGICPPQAYEEIRAAAAKVTADDVFAEQQRIRHMVMSLVNCIRQRVSEAARPYVHLTATTNDIVCSADALRYKAFTTRVLVPRLVELERTLIERARTEKGTLQIGRTHGQHAEPITFGFCLAQFVSRLGRMILKVSASAEDLRGKMAGAVGAHNASSLFFDDPQAFEKAVMDELGLEASPISTQIVEAEFFVDYMHALTSTFGVVANVADDLRQLCRSEIGEVEEHFGDEQVGSSTMPHKRNPTRLENIKSLWKEYMPRMATAYTDQISEHQRDLTNFESTLFASETACGLYFAVDVLDETLGKLVVRRDRMAANFRTAEAAIVAEPAHLLLSSRGHGEAHEIVRRLSQQSRSTGEDLRTLLFADPDLKKYLDALTGRHRDLLRDPSRYTGISSAKTVEVCDLWEAEMNRLAGDPG
jgi:adenylosuccinate lyase